MAIREETGVLGRVDWGAILLAVVVGLGVTLLLVAMGIAVGALVADDAGGRVITAAVGGWTVLSALLGTLVGTFVGGRFARSRLPGSAVYHGLGAWALTTVVTVWLGVTGVVGLLGSALRAVSAQVEAAGAPDATAPVQLPGVPENAVGWGGWALFLGLLLTLAVSIVGWWIGARSQPTRLEAPSEMPATGERMAVAGRG